MNENVLIQNHYRQLGGSGCEFGELSLLPIIGSSGYKLGGQFQKRQLN